MELSVRDWMIIIGVLLILAVLLDGYRRMRDPKRIRMSLSRVPEGEGEDDDVSVSHELPNGGARVKPRGSSAPADSTPFSALDDGPVGGGRDDGAQAADAGATPGAAPEPPLLTESAAGRRADADPDPLFDDPVADWSAGGSPGSVAPGENLDLLAGMTADSRDELLDRGGESPPAEEVLMLHVVARDESGFPGDDILQVLLAYNLRFGEMNFFHRHEASAGRGAIQFSVANMLNPGVFDIDRMADFSTTGLIFFLTLPGPRDMMSAFEQMVETARGVAEHLGGDVLDESRSALTRQTLEHMRQRIRELERRLLARARR